MKLMVRFRGVETTASVLAHTKAAIAEALRGLPTRRASLLLAADDGVVEALIEIALARGAVWVVRATSDDALVAIDAAADRVAALVVAERVRSAPLRSASAAHADAPRGRRGARVSPEAFPRPRAVVPVPSAPSAPEPRLGLRPRAA